MALASIDAAPYYNTYDASESEDDDLENQFLNQAISGVNFNRDERLTAQETDEIEPSEDSEQTILKLQAELKAKTNEVKTLRKEMLGSLSN